MTGASDWNRISPLSALFFIFRLLRQVAPQAAPGFVALFAVMFSSDGIGRVLFGWAIEKARARGCHMVQLTTDKSRPAALRFYESLGFAASHEGLKLHLDLADFDAAGEN